MNTLSDVVVWRKWALGFFFCSSSSIVGPALYVSLSNWSELMVAVFNP